MSIGVSEKARIEVNSTSQGMFLRGQDARSPVLLFVHGGPGMPEFFLERTHPTGLDRDFVVAWWEQRGSGLSYAPDLDVAAMTVDQLVADTIAVSDHLRDRFGQERIYLLGHSWGSFLGIQAAARAPDRFAAYVGMGQVSSQRRAERAAYEYALEAYTAAGDRAMVDRLRRAPVPSEGPVPAGWLAIRDRVTHRLGVGTTRDMRSVVTGVFLPVWATRAYTLGERRDVWRGKRFSHALLWDSLLAADLTTSLLRLEVPSYFCVGRHDGTIGYGLARAYVDALDAPVKGFYTFEDSAHSPAFEEPARMRRILATDVRHDRTTLADP